MAFSAALRRAASTTCLSATRALVATRRIHHSAPLARAVLSPPPCVPRSALLPSSCLSHFSSSSSSSSLVAKPASDSDLLQVIDSEIKCAEETDDHDREEEIPEMFPFKIQDDKGTNTITLRRTFQGEEIEIEVSMPSLVTGEEPEQDDNAEDGGDDNEKPIQSSLPLTVVVTKGDGMGLEFTCTAYPDDVVIDSMSVRRNKDSDEEMMAYEGPDFNDLDENLQKAFQKYLQVRGISPLNTNFLHEYMINKDSREYLFWMKNLKQFMQK